jgi:DNA-binding NarL/FixJ family response regulator
MSKPSKARPRLLIIDANTVCREGLTAIVGRDGRFEICNYAYKGESAAKLVNEHRPDLLLIEPFGDGLEGVWLIKGLSEEFQSTRIIAVSQRPEEVFAERILRAGANGYWMKNGGETELISCIETVISGQIYVSSRVALYAVHRLVAGQRPRSNLVGGLTDRELHVFGLIGNGMGPGRIAGDLNLSRKTIETYQERIKLKLGYGDASQLRAGARRWVESIGA